MKSFWNKNISSILALLVLVGFGYYYRDNVNRLLRDLINRFQPCERPITYSILSIDPRFGVTKAELLDNIKQAETIWESPIKKQLFEYSPTGDVPIDLIYDHRQKATDALQKLGIVIHDDQSTYDTIKAKYDSLIASYDKEKADVMALVETYQAHKDAFEQSVKHWNSRGGAPKAEYERLEQQKVALNEQVAAINQAENSLNALVEPLNATALVMNKLIAALNLQVQTYNTLGAAEGKEFNQGEYVNDANGAAIHIFQFDNEDKLIRVLAHEFGHALGLGHLDNPKAIMYRVNEGINEKLTADDLAALKKQCGMK